MTITAIVLTHNNEDTIEQCLSSLSFCSTTMVIDNNSTDTTRNIAKKMGAHVIKHRHDGNFAFQRNFAFDQIKTDWALFVDSDEIVPEDLAKEIQSAVQHEENVAYYIRRKDIWCNKELKHGEVADVYANGLIRLMRRRSGTWKGRVHEVFEVYDGEVDRLYHFLHHYPHQTVASFLTDVNWYSSLRAKELYEAKQKVSSWQLMAYPFGKFLYTYIIKLGFLDGAPGFVYSFLMSFHSFLVRAKLYQYYLDSTKGEI